ncbi:MAG: TonB family protein [Puniceicoccales bacterium]|jgi:protein TonB|nr:TonB family protein [Puniceicoccales bacterium]
MKLDQLTGIILAALIHAGVAFSQQIFPELAAPPKAQTVEEIPTIALKPLPQVEPDPLPPDENITPLETNEAPQPADIAPPAQPDVPAPVITNPAFVQQLQPPPPDLSAASAAITLPKANFAAQSSSALKNLINFKDLDQKPVPTFQARPAYPYEMRRAHVNGKVLVGFIVDVEGNVRDPYIINSTNPAFDAEALRAASRWKFRPGKKNGQVVNTRNVQLPFVFNLSDNS